MPTKTRTPLRMWGKTANKNSNKTLHKTGLELKVFFSFFGTASHHRRARLGWQAGWACAGQARSLARPPEPSQGEALSGSRAQTLVW